MGAVGIETNYKELINCYDFLNLFYLAHSIDCIYFIFAELRVVPILMYFLTVYLNHELVNNAKNAEKLKIHIRRQENCLQLNCQ